MKTFAFVLLAALALTGKAMAFYSGQSGDPNLGFRDVEFGTVEKTDSQAGYDDAITKGMGVFFEDGVNGASGGYKVSINYSGTYNTATASLVTACIAARNVATGDTGGFPCVVKGYIDYALYSKATGMGIAVGGYLCVSNQATAKGRLIPCGSSVTSPFVALEKKDDTAANTGSIKIRIVSP